MSNGARPAPKLSFSIGKGGRWRACDNINGVTTPHSSTRMRSGLNKSRPRGGPGSCRTTCQIPMEEPLSFSATQRMNSAGTSNHRQGLTIRRNFNSQNFGSPMIEIFARSAKSTIVSYSSNKVFPASTAMTRSFASAAMRIVSMPITGMSKRIS